MEQLELMSADALTTLEKNFFNSRQTQSSTSQELSDEAINMKYLKGEIRIVTEQARYPLASINEVFKKSSYDFMPDFQRRHRWDRKQQSKLIESFIMNVPIPPIFLYEKEYSTYEVMDGLQRLTAIIEFYNDQYELEGLEQWGELNGKKYSQLPEQVKKGIDRRYLSSIVLLKETAKTEKEANLMKQMVFSRINSGGAKLEDQEYRNSLYPGAFNNMLIELARNSYFCDIFGIPPKTVDEDLANDVISDELRENPLFSKMKDAEIVLRFFAMRNIHAWGSGTLTRFLDQICSDGQKLPEEMIEAYKKMFEQTIQLAYEIYEENVFRMRKKIPVDGGEPKWRWNNSPNIVVYDPVMVALSHYIDKREQLLAKRYVIKIQTQRLFEENETMWNGRNTSSSYVIERILAFENIFQAVL